MSHSRISTNQRQTRCARQALKVTRIRRIACALSLRPALRPMQTPQLHFSLGAFMGRVSAAFASPAPAAGTSSIAATSSEAPTAVSATAEGAGAAGFDDPALHRWACTGYHLMILIPCASCVPIYSPCTNASHPWPPYPALPQLALCSLIRGWSMWN